MTSCEYVELSQDAAGLAACTLVAQAYHSFIAVVCNWPCVALRRNVSKPIKDVLMFRWDMTQQNSISNSDGFRLAYTT